MGHLGTLWAEKWDRLGVRPFGQSIAHLFGDVEGVREYVERTKKAKAVTCDFPLISLLQRRRSLLARSSQRRLATSGWPRPALNDLPPGPPGQETCE